MRPRQGSQRRSNMRRITKGTLASHDGVLPSNRAIAVSPIDGMAKMTKARGSLMQELPPPLGGHAFPTSKEEWA
jgi:hypothetical protein